MTNRLSPTKAAHVHVRTACQNLLLKTEIPVRDWSCQVIGVIVSILHSVQFGELYYYRNLEKNKVLAQQACKGNFDASLRLFKDAKEDLSWWIANVDFSFKKVLPPNPDITLTTDASTKDLGQFMGKRKLVALGVWRSKGFISTIWSKSSLVRSQVSV